MRISSASTLVDSNLLLRLAERSHPLYPVTLRALGIMRGFGRVYACPQNCTEFWAVATRPISANGLGFITTQAEAELAQIETLFPFLPDDPAITQAGVSGKPTHDARLMAVALVHSVTNLLTFNVSDFTRFAAFAPSVAIVDPQTI